MGEGRRDGRGGGIRGDRGGGGSRCCCGTHVGKHRSVAVVESGDLAWKKGAGKLRVFVEMMSEAGQEFVQQERSE